MFANMGEGLYLVNHHGRVAGAVVPDLVKASRQYRLVIGLKTQNTDDLVIVAHYT